jgi:4-hydroxy-tetrahydrodipicolinate reductase
MHNVGRWSDGSLSIELDLTMAVGLEGPEDFVELGGPVPLKLSIPGGTPGDTATIAALVNCARAIPRAQPGLRTMLDAGVCGARAAGGK